MKISKLVFATSLSGLMFIGVIGSTDILDQYKEPYITHKFQVVKKRCEDTIHEGKEVQKCYLSDGKSWHWTEKPTYDVYKEGDTVKFVKYNLNPIVNNILGVVFTLSLVCSLFTGLCRLFKGEW